MSRILHILLPRILPRAIPLEPFTAEMIFTESSGADVPKATTVSPITRSGTPALLAREDAPSTSHAALNSMSVIPHARKKKFSIQPLYF